ncbi:MAG: hypothetical protein DRI39_04605 [Chloroflexi bacterium]|nr:MAG: hypothetical protein DRI39_04605 [Chloroflexota bacterium]
MGNSRRTATIYEWGQAPGEAAEAVLGCPERTGEAAKELQVRYFCLANSIPDAVVIHRGGKIAWVNAAGVSLLGADRPQDLIDESIHSFVRPRSRKGPKGRGHGATTVVDGECRAEKLFRADGEVRDVEVRETAVTFMDEPARQVVITDVTDRRRSEDALQECEARYSALVEQASDGMFIIQDGLCKYANAALAETTGYTIEDLQGMPFLTLVAPEQRQLAAQGYKKRITGQEKGPSTYEVQMRRKDGTRKRVEVHAAVAQYGSRPALVGLVRDTAGRKQAEEALWQSEETYRLIADNIDDVIMVTQPDHKVSYLNPACRKIFGYNPDELLGKKLSIPHPDDRDRVSRACSRAVKYGRRLNLEYRIQTKGGEAKWVSHSWVPIKKEGKLQFVVSVVRDISEHRWAEEALRESERRYRLVTENVSDVIVCTDLKMRPTYVSPSMTRFLGFSVEESMNRGAQEALTPDSLEAAARVLSKAASLNNEARERFTRIPLELEFYHKEGHTVWGEVTVSFLCNSAGQPSEMVMVIRDVTERKQALEALRESEQKYSALVEQAIDGVIILQDGLCKFVNQALVNMVGYTVEEVLDTPFMEKVAPESRDTIAQTYAARQAGEEVPSLYEARLLRKDGSPFEVEISAGRIQFEGKPADMAIIRDITERKQSQEKLTQLMTELSRSNAELEQFAYVASHDLQEPLRMVSSFLQLLARRYEGKLDEEADEFIRYAVDGARRMQGLINDLLTYSRVGTRGKPFEPTDCEEVLEQALANLHIAIEESGATVTHGPLPTVVADEGQLVQLLQNLVGNALKFRRDEPPRVHIGAEQAGDMWVFSVSDNGIGISPEYCDRIFILFQRLHSRDEYPGTGIGLAVCKKIVERHGGRIWVESEVGKGATFRFTLPSTKKEST